MKNSETVKGSASEYEHCGNCKHLVSIPKNNRYGDMEHFCMVTGYFVHGIYKDRNSVKRYTPGGKELYCCYERQ